TSQKIAWTCTACPTVSAAASATMPRGAGPCWLGTSTIRTAGPCWRPPAPHTPRPDERSQRQDRRSPRGTPHRPPALPKHPAAGQALVKDRTATRNRQNNLTVPLLKRQAAQRLRQIETQLAAVDREILNLIRADEIPAQHLCILVSIPGISEITAVTMIVEMPELGTLEPRQAASPCWLATNTRRTGIWEGRARIGGGGAKHRNAHYMPALVAVRYNPNLKRKYEELRQAGKPPKLAFTAIMR